MMDTPGFREFQSGRDEHALIALLTSENWPLRATTTFTRADVLKSIEDGEYGKENDLTFFIVIDGLDVGLVRLEDVADEGVDPALDIRILEPWRRRGLGVAAVRFITGEFFKRHPHRWRIEGQTRRDNIAMRHTFVRAGWVKEAVYRQAWPPDAGGTRLDGLGYAVLRGDWERSTTTPVDFSEPL
jgi:RimJ/RimL family protein N-acetyltransferase